MFQMPYVNTLSSFVIGIELKEELESFEALKLEDLSTQLFCAPLWSQPWALWALALGFSTAIGASSWHNHLKSEARHRRLTSTTCFHA